MTRALISFVGKENMPIRGLSEVVLVLIYQVTPAIGTEPQYCSALPTAGGSLGVFVQAVFGLFLGSQLYYLTQGLGKTTYVFSANANVLAANFPFSVLFSI